MFSNFIHLIVALLILSLYEPIDAVPFSLPLTLSIFFAATLSFALYTYTQFQRLERMVQLETRAHLDHRFSLLVRRHTILALVLFALNIWGLHLPAHLEPIQWLSLVPTLKSLLFLLLFVTYLALIWAVSYNAHCMIYGTEIPRKTYVYSNFAFTIPILIPWTVVFGIIDIVRLLPFETPKNILDTSSGQIVYFLLFLLTAAILAPVLMQRFWRCRPLVDSPMRSRIETLCKRAKVGYADIVHWPIFGGHMITAGVMGLISRFRYIMVTDALLEMLTPDQIDQVIAHEIGHIKHRHLQLYLLFFIGVMLISYTLLPLGYYLFYAFDPALMLFDSLGFNIDMLADIFASVLFVAGIVLYFRYLFGYFMRHFERQADTYVFRLFPTAQPLIETFAKIVATSGQPADKPNWHHFSIRQRVDFLQLCERSTEFISRHNRKVKKSIIIVLFGFALLGTGAYHMNQKIFKENNKQQATRESLTYLIVGTIHYNKKNFKRAAAAYEASLALVPNNADVLNNLSWLLASDDAPDLKDPQRALQLAQTAIAIKKAPHIWDTLAQALYVNGRIEEAIAAEEQALAMDPDDRHIYEAALQKFRQALDEATSQ